MLVCNSAWRAVGLEGLPEEAIVMEGTTTKPRENGLGHRHQNCLDKNSH